MEKVLVIIGILVVVLIIASNYSTSYTKTAPIITSTTSTTTTIPEMPVINTASINVPAVDNQGNGIVTTLVVTAGPGTGRALTDIDNLLFWVDTQFSIQTAKDVAENITGADLSKMDLTYAILTEAQLIEGPSAGAALTAATVAAIEGKEINENVMITGTVTPNGDVGPIGGVVAKAMAAKDVGATLFLVPAGQGKQTYYEPERSCELVGMITYCTTNYVQKQIDVAKDAGIEVAEVARIEDALKYLIE